MNIVVVSPSKEEVQKEVKAIRAESKKVLKSKESAKAYLLKNGFITKSGKLTKAYGG